jgi:guanine deaminase
MHTMKLIILTGVVLFGAFAQHKADNEVKSKHLNERKLMSQKSKVESNDVSFMERAIALSRVGMKNDPDQPFGSVVVMHGKIVGEGWNKVQLLNDPTAHAEVVAIRNASMKMSSTTLKDAVIYTNVQPCPMCLSLIYLTGIEKVFYCIPGNRVTELNASLSVDHIYDAMRTTPLDRSIPEIPIMADKVESLIDSYQQHHKHGVEN